jgi:hypothetical protein
MHVSTFRLNVPYISFRFRILSGHAEHQVRVSETHPSAPNTGIRDYLQILCGV